MTIPYSQEAEQCVVGACLMSDYAVKELAETLTPDDFYLPANQRYVTAILRLHENGFAVDIVTVCDELKRLGLNQETDTTELMALSSSVPALRSVGRYLQIVAGESLKRAGIVIGTDLAEAMQDPKINVTDYLDGVVANIKGIDSPALTRAPDDISLDDLLLRPQEERVPWAVKGILRQDWRALLVGREGDGKLLRLDEPIFTAHGWSAIGNLQLGETIFDINGQRCQVTALSKIKPNPNAYAVEFDDGTIIECDDDHQWVTVEYPSRSKGKHDDYTSKTTRQIRETLFARDGFCLNHSVPVAGPLNFPEAKLPLDPYLLGYWLGDGDTKSGAITLGTADGPYFEAHLKDCGFLYRFPPSGQLDTVTRIRVLGLSESLRELGVLGNKSIPQAYFSSSIEQRQRLLAGLMDSDGFISARGLKNGRGGGNAQCELTLTNKTLVVDALELIRGLGIKATIRESEAKIDGRIIGLRWRVCFTAPFNPFLLPRKSERWSPIRTRRSQYRYIKSVTPVTPTPMRCLQVDSPTHTFLVGRELVPTHNTVVLDQIGVLAAWGLHPFDFSEQDQANVLIVDLENPADVIQDRIKRLSDACARAVRHENPRNAYLWHRPGGIDLRKRSSRAEFENVLRRRRPNLVVFGPLYKAYSRMANENDEQVASEVQNVLDDLRTRYQFALVMEHHAPKGIQGARDLVPFGSSLWLRWSELGFSLTPPNMREHPAKELRIESYRGDRVEHGWPKAIYWSSPFFWKGDWGSGGDF